jgi:homoserine O-succinyltransferase
MPVHLLLDSNPSASSSAVPALEIGVINNMPDTALRATERQFVSLLEAAAEGVEINLSLYALPEVPRSEASRRHIHRFYSGIDSLLSARLDGLIVTGAEPRAASLREEPYWPSMTRVLDWAQHNTRSTIWSCLAAHAAVLHLDGIQRRKFEEKRFGVFQFETVEQHALTIGIDSPIRVPHSRWNDIAEKDLASCGYSILTRNSAGGVDTFARQRDSLFIFFQGHPEYEADTLLREYRRDVSRFLKGERDRYPGMPQNYLDPSARELLAGFESRAQSDRRESITDFPTARVSKRVAHTWRRTAAQLYRNWLTYLMNRKCAPKDAAPRIGARGLRGFSLAEAAAFRSSLF